MSFRRFNHALHRDVGYLCIGLTLIYALSGIAVNHLHDWNPNYTLERTVAKIPPNSYRGVISEAMALDLLRLIGERPTYENLFQPDPESLMVFIDGRVIQFHLPTGVVEYERVTRRPVWHALNFIHLNHAKKAWTWIADAYAVGLILLSLTGLALLPKGRLRVRCLAFSVIGILIPIVPLLLYY
jgi:hypothetical protein